MDSSRVIKIVAFVGFLVVFNVLSYVFHWPLYLW